MVAFTHIGASRTLILFGFQPIILGMLSYFVLGQDLNPGRLWAIIFLIGCLGMYSIEGYKAKGHWEVKGLVFALIGMLLDSLGIMLTRWGFDHSPLLTPMEGHMYRTSGTVFGFIIMSRFVPIQLVSRFNDLKPKFKTLLIFTSVLGTYLSLYLYLSAIQIGHLASISAIAITGPIFASLIESIHERKLPSRYSMMAFILFGIGYWILLSVD